MSSDRKTPTPPSDLNDEPNKVKVFPRNLTARADYIVRGNPTNSRPESVVNNSFPGLEIDTRTLEERFFPGIAFDFLREDGAVLTEITDPLLAKIFDSHNLTVKGSPTSPLYLMGIYGRTVTDEDHPDPFDFFWYGVYSVESNKRATVGPQIWRRVNALLPGRVAIAIGRIDTPLADRSRAFRLFEKVYNAQTSSDSILIEPKKGPFQFAVLAAERASYLTDDGVLDPDLFEPGDFTKTMCAPWMYDFRDCYCVYWASNKPDIVASPDGESPYVDFIRKRYPTDEMSYAAPEQPNPIRTRYQKELDYQDMVEGWWERLPVVLDGKEQVPSDSSVVRHQAGLEEAKLLSVSQCQTPEETIAELHHLAEVEHAVMVQYLYAYYSLAVLPPSDHTDPWETSGTPEARIQGAADQLMQIAMAEMRHFLWANLALRKLGARPSLGRAKTLPEPPQPGSGRKSYVGIKDKEYLNKRFVLSPLDRVTLDWFIEVEAPSKVINEGLDGMYVEVLESVAHWDPQDLNSRDIHPDAITYLTHLVKLIIDEGHDHYTRFRAIRATLADIPEARYLNRLQSPEGPRLEEYLGLVDQLYHLTLFLVGISLMFTSDELQSYATKQAVGVMRQLDAVARVLASDGALPGFRLEGYSPDRFDSTGSAIRTHLSAAIRGIEARAGALKNVIQGSGDFSLDQQQGEAALLDGIIDQLRSTEKSFVDLLESGAMLQVWH